MAAVRSPLPSSAIVVQDTGTTAIGSLIIPLSEVK